MLALDLEVRGGLVQRARVDMGEPILAAERIPTTLPGDAHGPAGRWPARSWSWAAPRWR